MNTSESEQKSSSVTRTYYALETFCENLGNVALTYTVSVENILEHLGILSTTRNDIYLMVI